eukprot:scaffold28_cov155-Amphora_coffeaeformis.AAC.3
MSTIIAITGMAQGFRVIACPNAMNELHGIPSSENTPITVWLSSQIGSLMSGNLEAIGFSHTKGAIFTLLIHAAVTAKIWKFNGTLRRFNRLQTCTLGCCPLGTGSL